MEMTWIDEDHEYIATNPGWFQKLLGNSDQKNGTAKVVTLGPSEELAKFWNSLAKEAEQWR